MAQFTNRASISYNGMTADSNIVTGEIVQVLTAEKTVLPTTYRSGDVLTYAVSIANSGTTPITGLTITDDLGAYNIGAATAVPLSFAGGSVLYYVNGALQAAPAVTPGAPLVISGISVPAGGSALIVYRAQVNDFAPPAEGGTITNRALISGGGLSEPVAATAAANAEPAAALEIIKALRPTTVTENGELFYTFTIQNSGAREAGADAAVVLRDTFDPRLNAPITVTLGGDSLPQAGNWTYDAASGEFATVAGRLIVPAATFTQNQTTGAWSTTPGVTVLTVSGTI